MSTATITTPAVPKAYPCTCRPGCGQTMATPGGEAHGWALACYKRWQRAGRPPGGPPPPLPVGRQPHSPPPTREPTTADLAALLARGAGQDRAAAILGLTRNDVRTATVALYEAASRRAARSASPPPPHGPACEGMDSALFFGRDGERQDEREIREREARTVCAGCPVRERCLEAAMERRERHGVFGGLNEDERAAMRRRGQADQRNAKRRAAGRRQDDREVA